ncbi:helix-turn-helix domain-containing protein [Serratia fonticola]|uniref:helix-turn-helix domain-containing protein n=1 Tax=Serratia fonticola TaxID=47917 RepID=UPI003AAEC610
MTPIQIKKLREHLNLSQSDLARVLNASLPAVKAWEQNPEATGYRRPSGTTRSALCFLLAEWMHSLRKHLRLPESQNDIEDAWSIMEDVKFLLDGTIPVDDALRGVGLFQQRVFCIYRAYIEDDILTLQNREYCSLGTVNTLGATKYELAPGQILTKEFTFNDSCPPWAGKRERDMYREAIKPILSLKVPYDGLTVGEVLENSHPIESIKYLD